MMGGMLNSLCQGWGGYGGFGWLGIALNLLMTLGLIAAIVLLVAWLVRRASPGAAAWASNQPSPAGERSAKEIVQIRYARGELNREQYQQMLADLS